MAHAFAASVVCLSCTLATSAFAADEVVVTATRASAGLPRDTLGASITTLTSEDLAERQVRSLADALRDVAGVAVNRAGPLGAQTQVRVRGTEANHVLVLVDGIEVTDPFLGEFDFSSLQVDEHARLEVLRGPQSALYGSDAIGGVIHYITQSGREAPGFTLRGEGGSFGTLAFAARAAGAAGDLDYAFSAGTQDASGSPTARNGVRDIGASNRVGSAKFGWQVNEAFALRAVARVSRANADFNSQDFNFTSPTYGYVVDGDDYARTRNVQGLVAAEIGRADAAFHQTLSLQGLDASRDSWSGSTRSGGDEGRRYKGSWVGTLALPSAAPQWVTFAVDREREEFRNNGPFASPAQSAKHTQDNTGVVAQYDLTLASRTGFGVALRHDANERFEDATTWRANLSQHFGTGTRGHVAAGTGIKNPSPTELFGFNPATFIGNPNLEPEKSRAWEVGIEQSLLSDRRATLGVTWSQARLDDEIYTRFSPTFVSSPDNRTQRSHQRSLESTLHAEFTPAWKLDASYTWLRARENGVEEVRRPPHIGSVNLLWRQPDAPLAVNLTARFNGSTDDLNFTNTGSARVRLASYTLVQLGARYAFGPSLEVFGRIENAFDESYEDVYTYRMPGRGVFAGLRASL